MQLRLYRGDVNLAVDMLLTIYFLVMLYREHYGKSI